MKMTPKELKKFIKEAEELLEPLKEKYGVAVDFGRISYSASSFTTKLEVLNVEGNVEDTYRDKYKQDAIRGRAEHLSEFYGEEVNIGGKILKVTGYNTRAPKNPIELEDTKGVRYKCPKEALESAIKLKYKSPSQAI